MDRLASQMKVFSFFPCHSDLLIHGIQTSTSPGHALLLCLVLQADYRKKEREEEAIHLIHQVRAVTVLSMAVKLVSLFSFI